MYKTPYIIILLLLCIYCTNPQISEVPGCTDKTACNFDESANLDDGSCEYSEENYDCGNNCLVDVDCAGVCGGSAVLSGCDNVCNSTAVNDCLGICSGAAVETDCGCNETASDATTACCADGLGPDDEVQDCVGVCGGDNSSCLDCCGLLNGDGSTCDGECGPCNDNIDEGRCDCDGRREDCAGQARVLRSQVLSLRERDYVNAAIITGESNIKVIIYQIWPQMLSLIMASFIGATVYAIGAQVGLEFLGLGDVDKVTWGNNLYWATNDLALLTGSWWTFVPTGLCIALVSFGLTLINYGIDEISNPRLLSERIVKSRLPDLFNRNGSTPVARELFGK